ncbi:MAG: MFS transporter [Pikeienuella sp.]
MTLPSLDDRRRGRAPPRLLGLLSLMTAVVAMTIDALLPALDAIATDLAFHHPNDRQWLIMAVLAGLGLGQPLFGILADALGRKPVVALGWAIYLAGTGLCLAAEGQATMLAGRALQGLGAAGPRVVAVVILRDLYEGRPMARMLSLVMTIFIAVPVLAPLLGQGIEDLGGWRAIFWAYLAMALGAALWYLATVPETLAPEARRPLSFRPLLRALAEIFATRSTMLHTAAAVCVFVPFLTYLATAQQVLEELYGLGTLFPFAFAGLALAFAAGSFLNSRLVMAFGMRRPSFAAALGLVTVGAVGTAIDATLAGLPSLWLFLGLMATAFLGITALFANLQALALQPLGHLAGTASAVVMSLTTLGATAGAAFVASRFDGSVGPLFWSMLGGGASGTVFIALAARVSGPERIRASRQ